MKHETSTLLLLYHGAEAETFEFDGVPSNFLSLFKSYSKCYGGPKAAEALKLISKYK